MTSEFFWLSHKVSDKHSTSWCDLNLLFGQVWPPWCTHASQIQHLVSYKAGCLGQSHPQSASLSASCCVDRFELFSEYAVFSKAEVRTNCYIVGQEFCMGVANRSQSVGTCTVSFRLSSLIIFWCLVHIMSWADSEGLKLPNHMLRLFSSEWELKIWDIVIYVLQKTQSL